MKSFLCLATISIFLTCGLKDSKFVKKKIVNNDITIKWFYYSYITSVSPDFVVVEKGSEKKEIYKATRVILDVSLKEHNIILKVYQPTMQWAYTKNVDAEVFGYRVVLDTTGTIEEFRLIPDGIKEGH